MRDLLGRNNIKSDDEKRTALKNFQNQLDFKNSHHSVLTMWPIRDDKYCEIDVWNGDHFEKWKYMNPSIAYHNKVEEFENWKVYIKDFIDLKKQLSSEKDARIAKLQAENDQLKNSNSNLQGLINNAKNYEARAFEMLNQSCGEHAMTIESLITEHSEKTYNKRRHDISKSVESYKDATRKRFDMNRGGIDHLDRETRINRWGMEKPLKLPYWLQAHIENKDAFINK